MEDYPRIHFSLHGLVLIFRIMEANHQVHTLMQLKSLIRKKSILAMTAATKKDELQVIEVPTDDKVMGHWMSVISVSGEQLHITFKVQFSIDMARMYAMQTFKNLTGEISDSHSKDFIREYCNMVAGYVKNTLIHNSISVGVSLPLLCRGFDDLFFDLPAREHSGIDHWKLAHGDNFICCASVIEVIGNLDLKNINEEPLLTGDIEFL